jgi:hypothetical protein
MDRLDADERVVAWVCAVCTVTYIARSSRIIIVFQMIQGIGNVDLVVLIVHGSTISSLRLPRNEQRYDFATPGKAKAHTEM